MAKYISIFDKIRPKLLNLPDSQSEAVKWYREQIRKLGGGTRADLLKDPKRTRDYFYPGNLFLFVYDPKLKATLPYYDKFPLVFPLEFYNDGFLGINLHYLDYRTRLELFHQLLTLADRHKLNSATRLKLSYQVLKGVAAFSAFKPCLKRYLSSHVQSQAIRIEAPDWETALFLPVENFAKMSKTKVWNDSADIIAGRAPSNANAVKTALVKTTTSPVVGTKRKGK